MAKANRKTIDTVFILLGTAMTVVLLLVSALSWHAYRFATTSVHDELAAQKIFFPATGSDALKALPPEDQTKMNQYAGQQLLDGNQAKVYANNFIAVHLNEIAGGQTYSQVSTAALQDPTNPKLQQEKQTLFQGETLRGLLLGDGYAYWTFGMIAQTASIATLIGAGVMAILVLLGFRHLSNLK